MKLKYIGKNKIVKLEQLRKERNFYNILCLIIAKFALIWWTNEHLNFNFCNFKYKN